MHIAAAGNQPTEEPKDATEPSRVSHSWTPFPDCIVHDAGAGLIAGGVGGSAFHFLKGLRSSPNGHRLASGAQAACVNAPRIGGIWSAWFGVFSAVGSAMFSVRRWKEDPWNNVVAITLFAPFNNNN